MWQRKDATFCKSKNGKCVKKQSNDVITYLQNLTCLFILCLKKGHKTQMSCSLMHLKCWSVSCLSFITWLYIRSNSFFLLNSGEGKKLFHLKHENQLPKGIAFTYCMSLRKSNLSDKNRAKTNREQTVVQRGWCAIKYFYSTTNLQLHYNEYTGPQSSYNK